MTTTRCYYKCGSCNHTWQIVINGTDAPQQQCSECRENASKNCNGKKCGEETLRWHPSCLRSTRSWSPYKTEKLQSTGHHMEASDGKYCEGF